MSEQGHTYSASHRALEVIAILTFAAFAVSDTWRVVLALDGPASWGVALGGCLAGYLMADMISGTVHWLADRFGTVQTPLFGPNFVEPFRNHHVRPKEIAEHDFIETNGNNCIVSFWILVLIFFAFPVAPGQPIRLFVFTAIVATMVAVMATNQFHKWAHMDQPPRFAALLQRLHLILPPRHHDIHHKSPFNKYYCITTGWLNWPLGKLRFFEALEWLALRVLGLKAGDDDQKTVALSGGPVSSDA